MPGKLLWISLSLIVFASCQKEQVVPSRGLDDWDYLPLKENVEFIYDYSQVIWSGRNIPSDTIRYLLKEQVVREVNSVDGTILFTMLTSKQLDDGQWQPLFYWLIRNEFDRSVYVIGNAEVIELKFPLLESYSWDAIPFGNSNCRDTGAYCDLFEVTDVDQEFSTPNRNFQHTTKIIRQQNLDPLKVSQDIKDLAVYAQGLGLVFSEKTNLEYASCRNGNNPDCCCMGDVLCTVCAGEIEFGSMETKVLLERFSP